MPDTRASTIRQEVAAGIDEKIRAQFHDTAQKFALIDAHFASINTRFDSFDKRFDEFTESLKLLSDRVPEHDSYPSMPKNASESQAGTSRLNHGVLRLAELILPRFSGDQLKDWLFRVEQLFEIHRTPDVDKVNIASVLMEDVAAQWHQSVQDSEYGSAIIKSWTTYREFLIDRFKEDPFEKMRAMFKKWREEDLIAKQKRKDVLSRKQSSMVTDSLTLLHATSQNTPLGDKPTAEIVAPEVKDPARASDPLDLVAVVIEGSSNMSPPYMVLDDDLSLDSRTEEIQHQSTTHSTLVSSSDEMIKEPLLLERFSFATNSIMVKDSMVSQVSLSTLEPCLQVSTVSVGVGDVRQMELGLADSCDRSFENLQVPSPEVWSDIFHESANVMPLELIHRAETCVVIDSHHAPATNDTRPCLIVANWHQVLVHFASGNSGFSGCSKFLETIGLTTKFLELLPHSELVLKLNFMPQNELHRLFLLETCGSVLDEFLSCCNSISFPLGCATNDWFLTTMLSSSAHSHVGKRVIQVWDPGGDDADMLGTTTKAFYTFFGPDQSYTESLSSAKSGDVSVLTNVFAHEVFTTRVLLLSTMRTWLSKEGGFDIGKQLREVIKTRGGFKMQDETKG